jgi:hypothetical protein
MAIHEYNPSTGHRKEAVWGLLATSLAPGSKGQPSWNKTDSNKEYPVCFSGLHTGTSTGDTGTPTYIRKHTLTYTATYTYVAGNIF